MKYFWCWFQCGHVVTVTSHHDEILSLLFFPVIMAVTFLNLFMTDQDFVRISYDSQVHVSQAGPYCRFSKPYDC